MAGRIPQSFINDLLARVDIVDVIGARITLKKAGKDHKALCPFHNEKTPSFTVSQDKQFYHCFGCGENGTALTFLIEHDRMEFVEAVESLASLAGVQVPREHVARAAQDDRKDLFEVLTAAERFFRGELKKSPPAIDYLKGRGITGVIARDFAIGYAPDAWHALGEALTSSPAGYREAKLLDAGLLTKGDKGRVYDRFRDRIMFPIRDTRGRVIGFGGRLLEDGSGPKYLNSPETPTFHKGRELYGLFEARKANRHLPRLLLVEGYMDVVALAQAGITNAAATLGTAATKEHFQKLYRYTPEVVCCFDGDNAGRQAAWRALEHALPELQDGRQLKFMFLPDGEDPDSLVRAEGRESLLARAASAQPAIEYLFAQLAAGLELRNLDDQAKLANAVVPYLEQVPDGILKELMTNRLSTLTGFSPAGRREAPRPVPTVQRDAEPLPALERRLLAAILQRPGLVGSLASEQLQDLDLQQPSGVLEDLLSYLLEHPDADTPELLGRWAGQPLERELHALARNSTSLAPDALQSEFAEGLQRFLAQQAGRHAKARLADLQAQPTAENLRRYWALKQSDVATD